MIYWLLLTVLYFNLGLPPAVTGDFSESDERMFLIAAIDRTVAPPAYRRMTLAEYRDQRQAASSRDFRLPSPSVAISDGDVDTVRVLEDRGDWQLIEYLHNDAATTASIYRATTAGIEPVSLRVISNVGAGLFLLGLIVPAYLLAWLTARYFRRPDAAEIPADDGG